MATSALIMMSLLNNSTMSNMFDITAQEKNKLQQIKKQQCENMRYQMKDCRASMYNNIQKTYNPKVFQSKYFFIQHYRKSQKIH